MTESRLAPRVRFELRDGVGVIVLDRPQSSNALDGTAAQDLLRAVRCAEGELVRCVVVTATGPRFCVGGDLGSFIGSDDAPQRLRQSATLAETALRALGELPQPVVVGVHGAVAGAGLSFVLNADLVVAARSTRFVMAYSAVGLTPDCGVSYLLPQLIGERRALQMALLGQPLSAAQALDWGLISEVVEDDAVQNRVMEIGRELAAGPTNALVQAKRLIRAARTTTRTVNAADEVATITAAVQTDAAVVRISGFLGRDVRAVR